MGAKEGGLFDDEELLLLGGPEEPPRGGESAVGGDSADAEIGEGVDGFDDRGELRGVALGVDASVLAGDEAKELFLAGLRLGCDGRAGDFRGVGGVFGISEFGGNRWKNEARSHRD